MATNFEKCADNLAKAAFGDKKSLLAVAKPFTKEAETDLSVMLQDPKVQRYLLGGLGGAGLGALIGSLQSRNKKRNALMYGLLGGAGGLGLSHLYNNLPQDNSKPSIADMNVDQLRAAAKQQGITPQELLKKDLADSQSLGTFGGNVASNVIGDPLADSAAGAGVGYGLGRGAGGVLSWARNKLFGAPKPRARHGLGSASHSKNPVVRQTASGLQQARVDAEYNRKMDFDRMGMKPQPANVRDAGGRPKPNPGFARGDLFGAPNSRSWVSGQVARGNARSRLAAAPSVNVAKINPLRRAKNPFLRALPIIASGLGAFSGIKKPLFGGQTGSDQQ